MVKREFDVGDLVLW